MCGRFGLFAPPEAVAEEFALPDLPTFESSYNIAPTDEGPTVGEHPESGERSFTALRWGLVPFWSDGPDDFSSDLINARAETVGEKPAFKKQFRQRRCVVPASGFYEWKPTGDGKQPYWIYPSETDVFGFAGLWDVWSDEESGDSLTSFTIITTEANDKLESVHDRMPVVLSRENYDTWLDPEVTDTDRLTALLDPCPDESIDLHPVSRAVNNPGYDEPECTDPVEL